MKLPEELRLIQYTYSRAGTAGFGSNPSMYRFSKKNATIFSVCFFTFAVLIKPAMF
jgi:hypothetical protein